MSSPQPFPPHPGPTHPTPTHPPRLSWAMFLSGLALTLLAGAELLLIRWFGP